MHGGLAQAGAGGTSPEVTPDTVLGKLTTTPPVAAPPYLLRSAYRQGLIVELVEQSYVLDVDGVKPPWLATPFVASTSISIAPATQAASAAFCADCL